LGFVVYGKDYLEHIDMIDEPTWYKTGLALFFSAQFFFEDICSQFRFTNT